MESSTYPYNVYYPASYQAGGGPDWPLLIFLHGAGERGSDLAKVKEQGLPRYLANQPDFPFVVAYPQCPKGSYWDIGKLDRWLEELLPQLQIDQKRIYLTGLSMGGYGTWHWATAHPDKFAAIVPICGGGEPTKAYRLKHTPVWIFHGMKDCIVPVSETQEMAAALKLSGGEARLTLYPHLFHDSWTETYNNPELYDWLLQHHK